MDINCQPSDHNFITAFFNYFTESWQMRA